MTDTTDNNIDTNIDTIVRTVDTHLAGYCEPDPERRAELLASVWAPDGEVIDPPIDGRGHAGIATVVDVLLEHYPGHGFTRTTDVDAHHDYARYGWALVAPDGTPAVTGTDIAQLDRGGKLTRIVGFFGDLAVSPSRETAT